MITEEEDNEALQPRRINRNARIREAWREASVVIDRANAKLGQTLREQYPEGTAISWKERSDRAIRHGLALSADDVKGPYIRVRDNITADETMLTVEDVLAGGDREY